MNAVSTPGYEENLVSASNERLQFTIFLAIAINVMLVFFVGSAEIKGDKFAPTLNVTLATHKSAHEPDKADFIAQHNQEASGTQNEIKELTTRQQAEIADTQIRDISPTPQIKVRHQSEADLRVIDTATSERKFSKASKDDVNEVENNVEGEERDVRFTNPEIASLHAKLDMLKEEYARQPRIRRLTSVSTKSANEAAYLNQWTQKVETVGNQHFPAAAVRDGIYGNLRMSVLLRADGSVEAMEILQSSGHHILDNAAVQIVKLSAPFPRFPKEITRNTDKLEIIRTWRFEITGLSTD